MCVNCYNRIITDKKLLQKCPVCRHDIFENLNHILYLYMDDVTNTTNESIEPTELTEPIEPNIDNIYDLEAFGDYENNCICTYDFFFTICKKILLFIFILGIMIMLVVLLGFIAKTIYK